MSEEQAERWAERRMDKLDKEYLRGEWTQAEYEGRVRAIQTIAAQSVRKG